MRAISLDCSACKTTRSMKATSIARFNAILRLIGVVIVLPSLLGMFLSCQACVGVSEVVNSQLTADASTGAALGTTIGAGIGYGFSLVLGAASLVGGLVGWILLMKRKVYRCARCGFILDRA